MKMSYNNKKKKQITLAMLNKQNNNVFFQRLKKKKNQTISQLSKDFFQHTQTQYLYKQNQSG